MVSDNASYNQLIFKEYVIIDIEYLTFSLVLGFGYVSKFRWQYVRIYMGVKDVIQLYKKTCIVLYYIL